MNFKIKQLNSTISVSGIVNVHFFDFTTDYKTKDDCHPFCELLYVNSGTLYVTAESYTGPLNKGEIIIHKPNERHSLKSTTELSPSVIIIGFVCNENDLNIFSEHPFTLSDAEITKLAEIVKEGRNVFAPPYNIPVYNMKKKERKIYGSEQLLRILLEYFLINLVRRFKISDATTDSNAIETFAIDEIVSYVDTNFLEKITIEELSFLFGTNRSTLCKEFKRATGKTLISYISDKKLELAKEKVINSNKSFTLIAEELNFESIHYFSRFFNKMTGLTPREYRKKFSYEE